MLTAFDVAEFFLSPIDEEEREPITHLKLQKLLYYAQGYSLALLGRPMFADKLENWEHGPVVPGVYARYKAYGSSLLPPAFAEPEKFQAEELAVLHRVRREKGQYSAWKLREDTHAETPWLSTRRGEEIGIEAMRRYFCRALPQPDFNFDLDRMKEAVEGDFHTIPPEALKNLESLEAWMRKTF